MLVVLCSSLWLLALLSFGEGYELLIFGGLEGRGAVYTHRVSGGDCELATLPEAAYIFPFGGLMGDNVTVCGGHLDHCYFLHSDSHQWIQSHLELEHQSSVMISTFDHNVWSVFDEDRNELLLWTKGADEFSRSNIDFPLHSRGCVVRRNQSHSILAFGSERVFWYEDGKMGAFQRWPESGDNFIGRGACGLVFDSQLGYQLVNAGGVDIYESGQTALDASEIFTFDEASWSEGPQLPLQLRDVSFAQYQNAFLIVGGYNGDLEDVSDTVITYRGEEGWIQLHELPSKDRGLGILHLPLNKILCT